MSQVSKKRKIQNEVKLFDFYDENIYFNILKYLDLPTLWKLRRVSKIFLDIFESYSKYDHKILMIGILNYTLSDNVKFMDNSLKVNTFNSLEIKDKKENIFLYFDFIKSDFLSKPNTNKNGFCLKKPIFFIPNNSNILKTIAYNSKNEYNYLEDYQELDLNNINYFNITKNNNICLIKNQLGILVKSGNIFKFHKYTDIRETYKCGLFGNKKYVFIFGGFNEYIHNYYPSINYLSNKIKVYDIENNKYIRFKSKLSFPTGGFGFIDIHNKNILKYYDNAFHVSLIIGGWIRNFNYIEPTPKCYLLFFLTTGEIKYKYLPNLPINIVYPNLIMDKNENVYVMGGKNPSKIISHNNHNINENRILYLSLNYNELSNSKWYILPKHLDFNIDNFQIAYVKSDKYFYLLEQKKILKNINLKMNKLKEYLNIEFLPYSYCMLKNYELTYPSNIKMDYYIKYSDNLLKFNYFLKSNNNHIELNFDSIKDARKFMFFFCNPLTYTFHKKKIMGLSFNKYCNTCLFYFSEYNKSSSLEKESEGLFTLKNNSDNIFPLKNELNVSFKKSVIFISESNTFKYQIKLNEMQKKGYECVSDIFGQGKNTKLIIKKTNELYLKSIAIKNEIQNDLNKLKEDYSLLNKDIQTLESKLTII